MDLEVGWGAWIGLICFRRMRWWTSRFHKLLGISWLSENLVASQEGLSSVELVNSLCTNNNVLNTLVFGCNVRYEYTALTLRGDCFDLYVVQFMAGHYEHHRLLCLVQKSWHGDRPYGKGCEGSLWLIVSDLWGHDPPPPMVTCKYRTYHLTVSHHHVPLTLTTFSSVAEIITV
jgi:hypothetical protein